MKALKNTKKLCTLAMLLAVAVVLGALSFRIGSGIKISFKFIPVFLSSVIFGPVCGGICGFLSDFLAYLFNPAGGAYLPQIGLVEALYGVSFGIFFYKASELNKKSIVKIIVCLFINTVLFSLLLMSFFLKDLMGMTFFNTLIMRIPSTVVNLLLHIGGICVMLKAMPRIKKLL